MNKEEFIKQFGEMQHKRCTKEELDELGRLNSLSARYFETTLSDLCYVKNITEEEADKLYEEVHKNFRGFRRGNISIFVYKDMKIGTVIPNDKGQPVVQENNSPYIPLISFLLEVLDISEE